MGSAARAAAERYVEAVNKADITALMALFAPGAVLRHPTGTHDSSDKIQGFYENIVFRGKAALTMTKLLDTPEFSMLEMYAVSPFRPDHKQWAVDVFEVGGGGLVTQLSIYYIELGMPGK